MRAEKKARPVPTTRSVRCPTGTSPTMYAGGDSDAWLWPRQHPSTGAPATKRVNVADLRKIKRQRDQKGADKRFYQLMLDSEVFE